MNTKLTFEEAIQLSIEKWEALKGITDEGAIKNTIYLNPKFNWLSSGCGLCEFYDDNCDKFLICIRY